MPPISTSPSSISPAHTEVVDLRRKVQQQFGLSSDRAAKILCAELIYASYTGWNGWESEGSKMHPAFWELVNAKVKGLLTETGDLYDQWFPRIEELRTRKTRGPMSEQARLNREKRKELGLC